MEEVPNKTEVNLFKKKKQKSILQLSFANKHPQSAVADASFRFLMLLRHFLTAGVTFRHFALREDQNGHNADHQGQVKKVQGYMQTGEQQGDGDGGDAPRPNQTEQQGVMEDAEDEPRDGQDESDQCGGQPGVERQRRQEESHCSLAHGRCLEEQKQRGH